MSQSEFSSREKRRFLRIPASANIRFRIIGQVINRHKLSKDLSVEGIKFLSDRFLPVGAHIKVEVQLEEGVMPVEFTCKVAWINSLFYDEMYEIGAQICDISKESRDQLKTYIATNVHHEDTGETK